MRKILIFGNSGSGKTTLAKKLVQSEGLAHLDLDAVAWLPDYPLQRAPLAVSRQKLAAFNAAHNGWVIEGCYTDLLELAVGWANEVLFMNLSISQCIENAQNRPWESHKYESKEAQDQNLEMLIDWIKCYEQRDDVLSLRAHVTFYERFGGKKRSITQNKRIATEF